MPGPLPRRRRRRPRPGVAALLAVAVALTGCEAPAASLAPTTSAPISTNTPQGLRAKQIVDMLNSDWPIGENGVKTLAAPDMVQPISRLMDGLWWDRPYTVSSVDVGAGTATLHLRTSFGGHQVITIALDGDRMVRRFQPTLERPVVRSWEDVDATLRETGARYAYQVAKVDDGRCERVAGTNTSLSLPLASIFKMYVLLAVADAVTHGTLRWTDQLTITAEAKALGSSGFDKLAPGTKISVRTAAEKMISTSDNMATDLLIARLGPGAVERALVAAGHHDPASMTPFPTMHEIFSVGWGTPDVRERWKAADHAGRVALLRETDSRPYRPDPERTTTPASTIGAEWYGSPEDICRLHAALQRSAVGKAAPVRDIMSAVPGIDLDRAAWPYIGAKAGNLPGDLTFSWYVEDRTGQPYVVSFQLNWPRYHGPSAGGWLMSIITQAFALITPR
ncbi:serine hydrolase [Mycobacterium sp. MYCO198283]|uniref:serine hydrolase n=1 Tax=Mycobacterium sp. MYCO198283 TaxID=2883505 RepID=UPI001E4BB0CE|nr:serine hydrolase [Mycobacterium sp. MYCO198283]MCG5431442.1 serine hydrolase [Mycobacterium sp. MYCO198283]